MSTTVDNRDSDEMTRYFEARIEVLQRAVRQLHLEVAELRRLNLQRELAIAELIKEKRK